MILRELTFGDTEWCGLKPEFHNCVRAQRGLEADVDNQAHELEHK